MLEIVIYCDKSCIMDKSEKACLLTEVLGVKSFNFYLWSDVIEQFHSRRINYYDYISEMNLHKLITL